jgi:hypothetical protein
VHGAHVVISRTLLVEERYVVLIDFRIQPELGEVGDLEKSVSFLYVHAFERILVDHRSTDGSVDREVGFHAPCSLELVDLSFRHSPVEQSLAGGLENIAGPRYRRVRARGFRLAKSVQGEEILLLSRDELG